jgi:hypothetical protein
VITRAQSELLHKLFSGVITRHAVESTGYEWALSELPTDWHRKHYRPLARLCRRSCDEVLGAFPHNWETRWAVRTAVAMQRGHPPFEQARHALRWRLIQAIRKSMARHWRPEHGKNSWRRWPWPAAWVEIEARYVFGQRVHHVDQVANGMVLRTIELIEREH